jgi:small neutral amino acid transporter SnatA (MarC family)
MPKFWSAFLPLFVAVDIVGVLPVYLGFVAAVDERARRRIVLDATLTAAAIGGDFCSWGMQSSRSSASAWGTFR